MKQHPAVTAFLAKIASKGGKARAKSLSPKRRSEIARIAVAAREARRNGKPEPV